MNIPEWLKPSIYGAFAGAVAVSIVGFTAGGWMTGGSANKMANKLAHSNVIEALVPICLDMSLMDKDRVTKLATIRDASSYKRRDAVVDTGWATVPGSEKPNRDLAQACIAVLDLEES